jgi:hypothetical protein
MPRERNPASDDDAIDPIPIADEEARSLVPRKCLRYLTSNPFRGRVCRDVDPDDTSALEPDNDKGIEQVETDSWNNEQVYGGNIRRVVTPEGSPSLTGRPPSFDHVLGDARLRDLKPELEQFAVDTWRAPKRIFDAHPSCQGTFAAGIGSALALARFERGYPQHIHNLKAPESEALTTTYCARIHGPRRRRGGFARRLVRLGAEGEDKA